MLSDVGNMIYPSAGVAINVEERVSILSVGVEVSN